VKTTVCLPQDLGKTEIDRWRAIRLLRGDLDNPFLSPEFTIAVGRNRPEARVAVVEEDGRVVAFFAFERRRFGLGVPIAAGLSDCSAIVCEPDIALDMHALLAGCDLAAWSFDHLIGSQRTMVAQSSTLFPSPITDVAGGFDAYLGTAGRHLHSMPQKERKLAREIGAVRFGYDVRDDEALTRLIAWKSEQYRRTGRPDRFARRSTVQLVHELAETAEPDMSGTLITLYAGDRLAAVEFSLRSQTTMAGWFPAHDCELSRYSPGSIRTLRTIEAAGHAGLLLYDFGKGSEEYKQWFKTGDLQVCEGWVVRPVALGYLRRAMSMPREIVRNVVLGDRRLRRAARVALERLGSARLKVRRPSGPT
jgi:CelD/BcsL family acetyltransferase involved in cellulose biosynthesis